MANKPKLISLKKRSEFISLKSSGKTLRSGSFLLVNYKPSSLSGNRYGWTIPKYVGTAVTRNKIRRWCKEYIRQEGFLLPGSYDINFVFKRKTKEFYKELKYDEIKSEFNTAKRRLNRIAG